MDLFSPLKSTTPTTFSLDEAKMKSLATQLHNHENKKDLLKTAKQFEGIFLKQLFDEMDKTVARSGLISGGPGEKMFRGMLFDKISQAAANGPGGSGLGLAEAIYRQMVKELPASAQQGTDTGSQNKGVSG